MRLNHPITQREYEIPEGATLMSTTDPQSHITYANASFVTVSGYERDELSRQPHNLVRHPDMPVEAFADMWATLKGGESWTALVKNRRKNGDYYWVRANATPMQRNGQLAGYMSVRTKPTRQEIEEATALYQAFREGRAKGLAFRKGIVVRQGMLAFTSVLRWLPVRWRLRAGIASIVATLGAASLVPGLAPALVVGITSIVALLACLWLESGVTRPLQGLLKQAQAVAAGNPAQSIGLNRIDEIGMLQRSINQAGLNLNSLVDDVAAQVSGLRLASGEIAAGNHDLSSRTEQTASSLQETAAAMEQIHGTVRNSADAAQQATQLAATASAAAEKGGQAVAEVVNTMHEIAQRSRQIGDITGVIDGIAFQTNLLALNAAVEAARAGEQGRGFAVVAAEVRGLAQRSADAAKQIKQLIGNSTERVEAGSQLVAGAGATMSEIQSHVRRVDQLISEISRATNEQSDGVGQVNSAVTLLDQSTQQNAALVEQSAAAAESLRIQADRLSEAVGVYRVCV